ncbi:MAG TPA: fused MFS/spermidine synthase [Acidimicrobiales bacterium]|nr:fused MFS/spermidine synthase [Acidimicrobiales bacterium]
MGRRLAIAVVFATSAAILIVEITAGRLLAPYVGVSLETFTAIIGVILAGIATGAGVGGWLADRHDPRRLLGPSLFVGGALVWIAVPIVRAIGPEVDGNPLDIVVLATMAFFLPAAVLSASTPIVAKLRLSTLEETGSVFGGLSAAGTFGGLAGTFLTGFVLVALLGTRTIMFVVGLLLVVGGVLLEWALRRSLPAASTAVVFVVSGLAVYGFPPECDVETRYACASVVVDEDDPSRRSLYLDTLHHARVDVDDPTHLDLRYIRLFADVAEALPPGPIDALHIGGGGFTVPTYLAAERPGSSSHVIEIDPGVVDIAEDRLGLETGPDLTVAVSDARTEIPRLADDAYDLVVGDAFSGLSVPWHLTTVELAGKVDRVLRDGGIYVLNVIDGGDSAFARAELATLLEVFDHVQVILPGGEPPDTPRNQVVVASDQPIADLDIDPADGVLRDEAFVRSYIDGAEVLTDDHAPVDQLLRGS